MWLITDFGALYFTDPSYGKPIYTPPPEAILGDTDVRVWALQPHIQAIPKSLISKSTISGGNTTLERHRSSKRTLGTPIHTFDTISHYSVQLATARRQYWMILVRVTMNSVSSPRCRDSFTGECWVQGVKGWNKRCDDMCAESIVVLR